MAAPSHDYLALGEFRLQTRVAFQVVVDAIEPVLDKLSHAFPRLPRLSIRLCQRQRNTIRVTLHVHVLGKSCIRHAWGIPRGCPGGRGSCRHFR